MTRAAVQQRYGGHALVVLAFVGTVAAYGDAIPFWDAKSYFNCIAIAVHKPFNLLNFRCVDHPSVVYLFLLGLTQYVVPWNVSLMYAVNALLGVASIVAFDALLRLLLRARSDAEYALVTGLYALAPLFVVHAVVLNVDYGLTAFFVLFLYFLVADRFWFASVFALATMLSKETGAAACALAVLAYVLAFTWRNAASWRERAARLSRLAPLAAAPIALVTYVIAVKTMRTDGSWASAYAPTGVIEHPVDVILNVNPADPGIRSFLVDIFVLNYQWICTAVVVAAWCLALVRRRRTGDERPERLPGSGLFLFVLLIGLVYIVTRYHAYNNARYVLIVSPVLVAMFHGALPAVFRGSTAARMSFLSVAVVLVFLSNFRTLDVMSKSLFGTIPFGSHAILNMPRWTGGPKLDSLVYNFETLQLQYLLNDLMQEVRPAPHTVFFMGDVAYNFPPDVDHDRYTLTVDPARTLPLSVLWSDRDTSRAALVTHLMSSDDRFFYVAFANADNHQLQLLLRDSRLIALKRYGRHGYSLDLFTLRLASTP